MKKQILLIAALLALSLVIFTGCSSKKGCEAQNLKYTLHQYSETIDYSYDLKFAKIPNKNLYKVTLTIEFDNYNGEQLKTVKKTHEFNLYNDKEEKDVFSYSGYLDLGKKVNAVNVRISNVECHYDDSWTYGFYGLFGCGGFIALVISFAADKIRDKKRKSM